MTLPIIRKGWIINRYEYLVENIFQRKKSKTFLWYNTTIITKELRTQVRKNTVKLFEENTKIHKKGEHIYNTK